MPVIINDFEVVVDPAEILSDEPAGIAEPESQSGPQPQPPPTAQDVDDMMRRQAERRMRVWAH